MLDPNPQAPALVPTPRLLLTHTRASRAVLDGAWWPRSRDALAELSSVVPALSERYGRIRSVLLNGSAWTGRDRRLAIADHVVRIDQIQRGPYISAACIIKSTVHIPPLINTMCLPTDRTCGPDLCTWGRG